MVPIKKDMVRHGLRILRHIGLYFFFSKFKKTNIVLLMCQTRLPHRAGETQSHGLLWAMENSLVWTD